MLSFPNRSPDNEKCNGFEAMGFTNCRIAEGSLVKIGKSDDGICFPLATCPMRLSSACKSGNVSVAIRAANTIGP
ncbi:hypothetical protein D3C72_1969320 [compost metagenome]